jgi:hypothetical protein
MDSVTVWGDFLQAEKVQYLLALAVVVFSKILGFPIVLSLIAAGAGLVLGVVRLPGAGEAFQSYLSGWSLVGMLAVVIGVALVKMLSGRGRGVFLILFLGLGASSVLNFFEPQVLPGLLGKQAASLSLNAFACLALCAAVVMTFRSAAAAVCAVLWVCVAVGFNGEGIIRALPSSWFNGQLRSLVLTESLIGEELPRFALRVGAGDTQSKLVALVSRSPESSEILRAQLSSSGELQVISVLEMDQVPANIKSVFVDLDSVVAYPSARCQPSAVAALLGITPTCREDMRGPGVVCISSKLDASALAQAAPGVSCDRIVTSVAALSFS